jgi:hypothetical protein
MPAKSVATAVTDFVATPGAGWSPGPVVIVTTCPHIVVNGLPAISAVTCTFTSGASSDIVKLSATTPTVLRCRAGSLLVNGDSAASLAGTGNRLTVTSAHSLRTS